MKTFKIGDVVKRINTNWSNIKINDVGIVIEVTELNVAKVRYFNGMNVYNDIRNLELVKEENEKIQNR